MSQQKLERFLRTWAPAPGGETKALFVKDFAVLMDAIFDDICLRAEKRMIQTGSKIEGAHCAALNQVWDEIKEVTKQKAQSKPPC